MPLTITNLELKGLIGEFLGFGDTVGSFVGDQEDIVEKRFDAGKRGFYSPICLDGQEQHQWSFLSPTRPFTFVEGQYAYDLPSDFAMLFGPIHFAIGSDEVWPAIEVTSPEKVLDALQLAGSTGRPKIAAYRPKVHNEGDFLDGMHYELLCAPIPQDDYPASLRYKVNVYAPTTSGVLPIGDQTHVQTLIESCLAACERYDKSKGTAHQMAFVDCLRASISFDRQVSTPDTLGMNLDHSDREWGPGYARSTYGSQLTTYNGVVPS